MAEEAAVFGRMGLGERGFTFWGVADFAGFFRFFFFHGHETFMVLIMGQRGCGFRGGKKEKEENTAAANQKKQVVKDVFMSGNHADI
ncbi:MAG: hypothetical protein JZU50_14795 [Desulfobulbaceae bacterium]|jgi:hypothetical protein|nr:hypothetical protein [Desulfobulbaceae bacterium]